MPMAVQMYPPATGKLARHGVGALQKMINPFIAHPSIEEQFGCIAGRDHIAAWGIVHGRSHWLSMLNTVSAAARTPAVFMTFLRVAPRIIVSWDGYS